MERRLPADVLGQVSRNLDFQTRKNLEISEKKTYERLRKEEDQYLGRPRSIILVIMKKLDCYIYYILFENLRELFDYLNSYLDRINLIQKGINHPPFPQFNIHNFETHIRRVLYLQTILSTREIRERLSIAGPLLDFKWSSLIIDGKLYNHSPDDLIGEVIGNKIVLPPSQIPLTE